MTIDADPRVAASPSVAGRKRGDRWSLCQTWPREKWENNLKDAMVVIKIWMDADRMKAKLDRECR